jgi:ribulose 1,5-bisphosphate synthetase/thiazole synthase
MEKIFSEVGEKDVTRAIVAEFSKQFQEYVESDAALWQVRSWFQEDIKF